VKARKTKEHIKKKKKERNLLPPDQEPVGKQVRVEAPFTKYPSLHYFERKMKVMKNENWRTKAKQTEIQQN
jgi:hypothetical protein